MKEKIEEWLWRTALILLVLLVLQGGREMNDFVQMRMEGNSMSPFINDSTIGIFEPIDFSNIHIGDVLVFCGSPECNKLVAHSFVFEEDEYLYTYGLNTSVIIPVPKNYFKYKLVGINQVHTINEGRLKV